FPIHEGLLSERGWALAYSRYNAMTPTQVHDLRDGRPWTPAH
ncbi:MAG: MBL fold metallo-hydrolase, partial [Propioniciclava sp.]